MPKRLSLSVCVRVQWEAITHKICECVSMEKSSAQTHPFWTLKFWFDWRYWSRTMSNDVERCRTLFVYCRNMFPKCDARPFDACRPTEVAYSNDTQNDVERHHWFLGFSYRFRTSGLIACNHQEWCSKELKAGFQRMQKICPGHAGLNPGVFVQVRIWGTCTMFMSLLWCGTCTIGSLPWNLKQVPHQLCWKQKSCKRKAAVNICVRHVPSFASYFGDFHAMFFETSMLPAQKC